MVSLWFLGLVEIDFGFEGISVCFMFEVRINIAVFHISKNWKPLIISFKISFGFCYKK